MEQEQTPRYATLLYDVKRKLGISWNEYILLDMVHRLGYRTGYCYKSVTNIAEDLGFTKRGTNKMIVRLVSLGLLERFTDHTLHATESYSSTQYLEAASAEVGTKFPVKAKKRSKSGNAVPKSGNKVPASGNAVPKQQGARITYRNTIENNTTNVVLGADTPVRYGNPEINEMFDFWQMEVGYTIESKEKPNRNACSNLLKKCGKEKLQQLIRGVALTHSDQYAPRISDFISLQSKINDLILWGRKKGITNGQRAVDLTQ